MSPSLRLWAAAAVLCSLISLTCASSDALSDPALQRSAIQDPVFLDLGTRRCHDSCNDLRILFFELENKVVQVGDTARGSFKIFSPCFKKWELRWGDNSTMVTGTGMLSTREHVYAQPGVYTVKLYGYDSLGNKVKASRKIKVIQPCTPRGPCLEHAILTLDTTAPVVAFGDSAQVSFSIDSASFAGWALSWGDGSEDTGNDTFESRSHTYAAAGTYSVVLQATNTCGDRIAKQISIQVKEACVPKNVCSEIPLKKLEVRGSRCESKKLVRVSFELKVDAAVNWSLDWGDGSVDATGNSAKGELAHQYAKAGRYTITFTAINLCGNNVTRQTEVEVLRPGCKAARVKQLVLDSPVVLNGEQVQLAYKLRRSALSQWTLDWGDGSAPVRGTSSAGKLQHVYTQPGVYFVVMTATNQCGDTMQRTVSVQVKTGCRKLRADQLQLQLAHSAVEVAELVQLQITIDSVSVAKWTLNWGDGSPATQGSSAQGSAMHAYDKAGNFTITLTAIDLCGNVQTSVQTVTVSRGCDVHDLKDFTVLNAQVRVGDTVNINMRILSWDFKGWTVQWGDSSSVETGSTKTGMLSHVYNTAGVYTVTLSYTNQCGQTKTATLRVNVVAPTCKQAGCINQVEYFTSRSNQCPVSGSMEFAFKINSSCLKMWTVQWGDSSEDTRGTTSIGSVSHTFASAGIYTIRMKAVSTSGDVDEITKVVIVA